jgi:hypothetical protein
VIEGSLETVVKTSEDAEATTNPSVERVVKATP